MRLLIFLVFLVLGSLLIEGPSRVNLQPGWTSYLNLKANTTKPGDYQILVSHIPEHWYSIKQPIVSLNEVQKNILILMQPRRAGIYKAKITLKSLDYPLSKNKTIFLYVYPSRDAYYKAKLSAYERRYRELFEGQPISTEKRYLLGRLREELDRATIFLAQGDYASLDLSLQVAERLVRTISLLKPTPEPAEVGPFSLVIFAYLLLLIPLSYLYLKSKLKKLTFPDLLDQIDKLEKKGKDVSILRLEAEIIRNLIAEKKYWLVEPYLKVLSKHINLVAEDKL